MKPQQTSFDLSGSGRASADGKAPAPVFADRFGRIKDVLGKIDTTVVKQISLKTQAMKIKRLASTYYEADRKSVKLLARGIANPPKGIITPTWAGPNNTIAGSVECTPALLAEVKRLEQALTLAKLQCLENTAKTSSLHRRKQLDDAKATLIAEAERFLALSEKFHPSHTDEVALAAPPASNQMGPSEAQEWHQLQSGHIKRFLRLVIEEAEFDDALAAEEATIAYKAKEEAQNKTKLAEAAEKAKWADPSLLRENMQSFAAKAVATEMEKLTPTIVVSSNRPKSPSAVTNRSRSRSQSSSSERSGSQSPRTSRSKSRSPSQGKFQPQSRSSSRGKSQPSPQPRSRSRSVNGTHRNASPHPNKQRQQEEQKSKSKSDRNQQQKKH